DYSNPYVGSVTSVPSDAVQRVLNEAKCYGGGSRQQVNNIVQFNAIIPKGDIYVGASSFGDVAVLYGQGDSNPSFIAYLCNRGIPYQANLNPMNLRIGSYGECQVKQLTSATLMFAPQLTAEFR